MTTRKVSMILLAVGIIAYMLIVGLIALVTS